MKKLNSAKLWLISSVCFLFVGIMNIIDKEFTRAAMFIFLGVTYFALSQTNLKGNRKK
jgi:hypothetical protein